MRQRQPVCLLTGMKAMSSRPQRSRLIERSKRPSSYNVIESLWVVQSSAHTPQGSDNSTISAGRYTRYFVRLEAHTTWTVMLSHHNNNAFSACSRLFNLTVTWSHIVSGKLRNLVKMTITHQMNNESVRRGTRTSTSRPSR